MSALTAVGTRRTTYEHARRKRISYLLAITGLLLVLATASIAVGVRTIPLNEVLAGIQGSAEDLEQAVIDKRIVRTVLAILLGAALGVAGTVMQGVTRNPLADPGILGVNMGAALAVVIGIAWFGMYRPGSFVWVGILGAGMAAVFVYVVGSLGRGGATPLKLALAGAATTVAFSSFISAVVLPRNDIADGVRSWQIGNVSGATTDNVLTFLPFFLAGTVLCWASARGLNSLALGDDLAAGLGEHVILTRAAASAGAVILCGAATAMAGPIGFVGLVIPHVVRLMVGVDHRWMMPFSALGGAALLSAADILGRVAARPAEIDVGIITALIGGPFFIYIVRKHRVREL
ncbi:iron complex transport system permease protein [Nesterenkonia lutea]|uniref:Iron complex transport system permease protein n=1 Tax=Nesterenkonia lutea TaxID=272919 RepID=A0ABR9JCE0_9MICC|nr:iron ABC transporter permease [Nesterenkonia lutea]MBE1523607.1 iron complex transport system permease protein [Nesterenkonia lutea]